MKVSFLLNEASALLFTPSFVVSLSHDDIL